jgi:hypothetical protein
MKEDFCGTPKNIFLQVFFSEFTSAVDMKRHRARLVLIEVHV